MKLCLKCNTEKTLENFSKKSSERDGLSYHCKACCSTYHSSWRAQNIDKRRAYLSKYYLKNSEHLKASTILNRHAKREKYSAYELARRKANPSRCRKSKSEWAKRNPACGRDKTARRRAALRRGQPPWIDQYKTEMKAFYAECHSLGLTADHEIPILGKTVCGLHVPWNMQMLTLEENSRKGNKVRHDTSL